MAVVERERAAGEHMEGEEEGGLEEEGACSAGSGTVAGCRFGRQ